MKRQSLKQQTVLLTGANALVRMLGFAMRIWLSRAMGAEAMGVMELATSAHMLWISPVTSGLPMAVSRHTARAQARGDIEGMRNVLSAGKRLARRLAWGMFPVLLLLSPFLARLLGDVRTLPALWMYLPCLPILALSAAYNGYCYGAGNTLPPALSELAEQILRFALCAALFASLPRLNAAWTAAVPPAALVVGEGMGLLLVITYLRGSLHGKATSDMVRALWRLSAPMTCMRLCHTLMRTVNAVLIPARLRVSGLLAAEATAQLGMIQGMAMPLIMLPAVFTGALSMVAAPALAIRENQPDAMRRLIGRILIPTLWISLLATGLVWFGAPFFAHTLYRQPDLVRLLRALSPMVVLMGIQQVVGGMLAGLGRQRKALYASLAGAMLTVLLNYALAAQPALRLTGCAIAMEAGYALTLLMNVRYLAHATTHSPTTASHTSSQPS